MLERVVPDGGGVGGAVLPEAPGISSTGGGMAAWGGAGHPRGRSASGGDPVGLPGPVVAGQEGSRE